MLKNKPIRNGILVAAVILLFFASLLVVVPMFLSNASPAYVAVPLTLLLALALFLSMGKRLLSEDTVTLIGILAMIVLALAARVPLLSFCSDDYYDFLKPALAMIRTKPGLSALGGPIADFNVLYSLAMVLFAQAGEAAELCAQKLYSLCFDVLTAYFVMRLVSLFTKRRSVALSAFILTLYLPTLLLNSAYWGQHDSVYLSLSLGALCFGIEGRSRSSVVLFALALASKLQAIFLLPMLAVFLLAKRVRWKDLWLFAAVCLAAKVPALLAGRDLVETLTIYLSQAGQYSDLSMHAASVFGLFGGYEYYNDALGYAGILVALGVCIGLLLYIYRRLSSMDKQAYLEAALLFALCIPYLLPHMHDRYFICADALTLVYAFAFPRRWFLPGVVVTCSFISYFPYVFGIMTPPVPVPILSLIMLAVILYTAMRFVFRMEEKEAHTELPLSK